MTLPYRKSAGADRCRWPEPAADGRCRYCGWALTQVRAYDAKAGYVTGHYRHRKPRLPRVVDDASEGAYYPHEASLELTLSEAIASGSPSDALPLSTNRTHERQGTYPHQVDSNRAFRQYTGAGARLAVPTLDEWAAWKARWA